MGLCYHVTSDALSTSLLLSTTSNTRCRRIGSTALAAAAAAQLVMSAARTAWPGEGGCLTTEQILPLIRNAHGRENLSQLATGLDMANNFSLKFLEEFMPGFLSTINSKYYFPFVSKKKKEKIAGSSSMENEMLPEPKRRA